MRYGEKLTRRNAVTALSIASLALGRSPVLGPRYMFHEAEEICAHERPIEPFNEFLKVLDVERQATEARLKDTVAVLPPRPDVYGKAVPVPAKCDADNFAGAARPFRDDDREPIDSFGLAGSVESASLAVEGPCTNVRGVDVTRALSHAERPADGSPAMNRSIDAAVITVLQPIFLASRRPARSSLYRVACEMPSNLSASVGAYNRREATPDAVSMMDM